MVGMAGFEPTTTYTPSVGALPGCATSRICVLFVLFIIYYNYEYKDQIDLYD